MIVPYAGGHELQAPLLRHGEIGVVARRPQAELESAGDGEVHVHRARQIDEVVVVGPQYRVEIPLQRVAVVRAQLEGIAPCRPPWS